MGYWNSFDCQVQCEEFFLPLFQEEESEDIMNRCEVQSLEALKTGGSYRMEDEIIEAEECDWLWDTRQAHDELDTRFRARKVGM